MNIERQEIRGEWSNFTMKSFTKYYLGKQIKEDKNSGA
jgi:hypothetical protein